ncbi:MAG: hypothetical protein R2794_10275 [Chitinophagales bacterium]
MQKKFIFIILLIILPYVVQSQAVGYQGKKCIASLGYMPLNNLSGTFLGIDWTNYEITEDQTFALAPYQLVIRHTPYISLEYVLGRELSIWFRYNPFSTSTNAYWYNTGLDSIGLVQANTSGNMFSLGLRKYMRSTAAPLSAYLNFYVTMYPTHSDLSASPDSPIDAPKELLDHSFTDQPLFGLSVAYGYQNIFWDKVTLDLSIALGYIFGDAINYAENDGLVGDNIYLVPGSPLAANFANIQSLFFATPSIGIGYLLF